MPTERELFAEPDIMMEEADGGAVVMRSRLELGDYETRVGNYLRKQAEQTPDKVFLAERDQADWRRLTYAEALKKAESLGQAFLNRGLSEERPLMILSGNSIDHALLTLAGYLAGVPVAPVSQAYSMTGGNLSKLRLVAEVVSPGLVYGAPAETFAKAVAAVNPGDAEFVTRGPVPPGIRATEIDELLAAVPGESLREAERRVTPDTPAKYLFTSGSTGSPKGVITTHRMLCSNQAMLAGAWPALVDSEPVLVDWLPWHHTFGGSFVFNLVLSQGGTLFIDNGKPAPDLIEKTVANLRAISPTLYFNVPAGYAQLVPFMEEDADLRDNFFRRLEVVFCAAAALPQDLLARIQSLAEKSRGSAIPLVTAWGTTETAPLATMTQYPIRETTNIGVPVPGVTIKMAPAADKMELRVSGPNVTPGYLGKAHANKDAFDGEGFYRTGDAGELADSDDPSRGLIFKGRLAENFKLDTGTWVNAGKLRVDALAAASPLLQDAVITGHDRSYIGLLAWPNWEGCRKVAERDARSETAEEILRDEHVIRHLKSGLLRHNKENPASSTRIRRVMLLTEPPDIDANEVTDKGYINQRATLENRAHLVEKLYEERPPAPVIVIE